MKEIGKIRIRQWNQDNPYIQMKNLENAQPGYRVHTVNDDHHLYELPLETQNIILDWVFWNWKRFRKWGGIPSGITQNIKDLLASREIENIFENSDFILMLNQAAGDRQILAKQLNISPYQLSYVTNSGEGEGLLFYGTTIIPFKDKFDKNLKLYSLMTTKPEEVEKREKEMEAEKHEGNR